MSSRVSRPPCKRAAGRIEGRHAMPWFPPAALRPPHSVLWLASRTSSVLTMTNKLEWTCEPRKRHRHLRPPLVPGAPRGAVAVPHGIPEAFQGEAHDPRQLGSCCPDCRGAHARAEHRHVFPGKLPLLPHRTVHGAHLRRTRRHSMLRAAALPLLHPRVPAEGTAQTAGCGSARRGPAEGAVHEARAGCSPRHSACCRRALRRSRTETEKYVWFPLRQCA